MIAAQRWILAISALLIAGRLFLPLRNGTGYASRIDFAGTLLQVAGITILGAAAFLLSPELTHLDWRKRRGSVIRFGLWSAWGLYLVFVLLGVQRFGVASSVREIQWGPTGLAVVFLVYLAWVTWRWRSQQGRF